MSVEKPNFSNEEVENMEKKAEETMTQTQKELSFAREKSAMALRNLGVEGHLYGSRDEKEDKDTIEGEANGHKLYLEHKGIRKGRYVGDLYYEYSGSIDGKELPGAIVEELFKKYKYPVANLEAEENKKIDQARDELKKENEVSESEAEKYKEALDILKEAGLL